MRIKICYFVSLQLHFFLKVGISIDPAVREYQSLALENLLFIFKQVNLKI